MGDSMPKPKELTRCDHPWDYVVRVQQKTVVGEMEMLVDSTEVYFCENCESVLEEVCE